MIFFYFFLALFCAVSRASECQPMVLDSQYDIWRSAFDTWHNVVKVGPYMSESHDLALVLYWLQTQCPSAGGNFELFDRNNVRYMQTDRKLFSRGVDVDIFDCNRQQLLWHLREKGSPVFSQWAPEAEYTVVDGNEQLVGEIKRLGVLSKDYKLLDAASGDVIVTATREYSLFTLSETPTHVSVVRPQHALADPRIMITFLAMMEIGTASDGCSSFMTTGVALIVIGLLLLLCAARFVCWPRYKKWRDTSNESDSGPETGMGEHIDIDLDTNVLSAVEQAKQEAEAVRAAAAAAAARDTSTESNPLLKHDDDEEGDDDAHHDGPSNDAATPTASGDDDGDGLLTASSGDDDEEPVASDASGGGDEREPFRRSAGTRPKKNRRAQAAHERAQLLEDDDDDEDEEHEQE